VICTAELDTLVLDGNEVDAMLRSTMLDEFDLRLTRKMILLIFRATSHGKSTFVSHPVKLEFVVLHAKIVTEQLLLPS
jgi:hypothetical protein